MVRSFRRRRLLAAVGMAALAGCLGGGDADEAEEPGPATTATASAESSTTGSAGPPTAQNRLPLPMEPSALSDRAVSGGPPKDGIPSIDDPNFVAADEAPAGLQPGDPVFGVVLNGEARAYPQTILAQHEICNDTVGDAPSASPTAR